LIYRKRKLSFLLTILIFFIMNQGYKMSLYILKCDNCGKSNELDPKHFIYGEEDRIEKELGEEVTYSVTE